MKLSQFIEEFNEEGFDGSVAKVFGKLRHFLNIVLKYQKQDEIDISKLDSRDFNDDENLFEFLKEKGFLEGRSYDDFEDELKNYYLEYFIQTKPNEALKYICDHLLTDVQMRDDGFWLYLRDREELATFFDDRGRDTTAADVAKAVFKEDMWDPFWDTTNDVYNDVIEDFDESNLKHLGDYILKQIGDRDLNVEDYESDFFTELAETQNREGFFRITQDNVGPLIGNKEAMNELLDGDLSDLKSELYSLHNNAYNSAYESECYNLVYGGLDEFFSSKVEDISIQSGDKTRWLQYIKIRFFKTDVLKFIEENKGGSYNQSVLEYWGNYTSMMGSLFEDGVYEQIDFRVPEYADWDYVKRNINDMLGDYI